MRPGAKRSLTALALIGVSLATGCSGDDTKDGAAQQNRGATSGTTGPTSKATVIITKTGYHPRKVTLFVGGTITWINRDPDAQHTAETAEGRYHDLPGGESADFDTHTLTWNEPYTVTFHKPGTYDYHSSYDGSQGGWAGTIDVVMRAPPRR